MGVKTEPVSLAKAKGKTRTGGMNKDDKPNKHSATPQTQAASFRLGFEDDDLLRRDELRPVRLQLELLKPDLILEDKMRQSRAGRRIMCRSAAPCSPRARSLSVL